ncbi:MAG: hypothetical protein V4494_07565 [Chlamydiota bacterium]
MKKRVKEAYEAYLQASHLDQKLQSYLGILSHANQHTLSQAMKNAYWVRPNVDISRGHTKNTIRQSKIKPSLPIFYSLFKGFNSLKLPSIKNQKAKDQGPNFLRAAMPI